MFYQQGKITAQRELGLTKEAGPRFDRFLLRLAQGKGRLPPTATTAEGAAKARIKLRQILIGNPEHLITQPGKLVRDALSLQPLHDAIQTIQGLGPNGAGTWARLKGVGNLGMEAANKAFVVGLPAYGVHQALTTPNAPGQTRGERIGTALGEGLGWLPPMGILGTGAAMLKPEYSVPGLTGRAGGLVGRGISALLGEKPAPIPPEEPPQEDYYGSNKQLLKNQNA